MRAEQLLNEWSPKLSKEESSGKVTEESFLHELKAVVIVFRPFPSTTVSKFEQLANADVCNWLWKELRYYDGIETAYLNLDLKLDELRTEAEKREQVLNELKESYVSASNDQAPLIWTV